MNRDIIVKFVYVAKSGKAVTKYLNRNYKMLHSNLNRYRNFHMRLAKNKTGKESEAYLCYKQKYSRKEFKQLKRENPLYIENPNRCLCTNADSIIHENKQICGYCKKPLFF